YTTVTFDWNPAQNVQFYRVVVSTDTTFSTGISSGYLTTNQFTVTNLSYQTYYWKVWAYGLCDAVDSVASAIYTFSIFRPDLLPGLALWLRGDSGVVLSG